MKTSRALVIDDEQVVLDSVTRILGDAGFLVDTSLRGRDGLTMALDGSYDVVLTDIRMPDIGGMLVLREVKRKRPATPMVIITGFATVRSAVQAIKLGAEEYVEKPFTPVELVAAVRRAMDRSVDGPRETQDIIHKEELIRVLERAAADSEFVTDLVDNGVEALAGYELTGPEKLAVLTGDIAWIEKQIGTLTDRQRSWLEQRLSAEIW